MKKLLIFVFALLMVAGIAGIVNKATEQHAGLAPLPDNTIKFRDVLALPILNAFAPEEAAAQIYGNIGRVERLVRINPATTQGDSSLVEGKVTHTGKLNPDFTRLEFSLTVITRGTNDSLNVYFQTSPNPDDSTTYPWVTLTNFGVKTATGTTRFSYPTSVAARDTVMAVFPHFRVVEDHAPGTTGNSHAAADTSTWSLTIMQKVK